jgi:hypothetical protein
MKSGNLKGIFGRKKTQGARESYRVEKVILISISNNTITMVLSEPKLN